ncbi:hypothetical protein [Loktanella sp. SALINAS62]|nr:hypothetical protein [Loktanella sp. SALINAS62]MBS1301077.1 hypothetical protein [Loktanella sp. SALINAS62]
MQIINRDTEIAVRRADISDAAAIDSALRDPLRLVAAFRCLAAWKTP